MTRKRPSLATTLKLVVEAYTYAFPLGTVGGTRIYVRSHQPAAGDFVNVMFTGHRDPMVTMGWLLQVTPGANEFETVYRVECLNGRVIDWKNVRVYAIPVGDPFEHGQVDARFRPPEAATCELVSGLQAKFEWEERENGGVLRARLHEVVLDVGVVWQREDRFCWEVEGREGEPPPATVESAPTLQAARDAMFACFGLVDRDVERAAPGDGDQVPRRSEGEKV